MYVAITSLYLQDQGVTHIRRAKIPSHIYAKHQYRQESECGSTLVIYIPTERYKYVVITECDTILQDITSPENTKVRYTKG